MQTYSKNKDCKHKIEVNSNKYTFIWKKKVNKFYEKLKIKINNFWYSFNENDNTEFNDIYEIKEYLEKEILDRNIEFIYGKRVHKTQQQRDYETVTSYIKSTINIISIQHSWIFCNTIF